MDNTDASSTSSPQTLMDLLRDPRYTLETRALLLGDIRRFKAGTITPNYWTFRHDGDEVVVNDYTLAQISKALARSAGTKVRLAPRIDRNATLEEVLTVHGTAREALFREALGYLAECHESALPDVERRVRVESAFQACRHLRLAYAKASEDNGGNSSIRWEDVDAAHAVACEALTSDEDAEITLQAKRANDHAA